MRVKSYLKLSSAVFSFAVIIIAVGYFALLPKKAGDKTTNVLPDKLFGWRLPEAAFNSTGKVYRPQAHSNIRNPNGAPQGLPVRLKIPAIGVDTVVEDALITPDGRMDVPAGSVNVAWFSLGPNPGQVGSAVIGGHFGIQNGVPFVFYNLDKLKVGDKIYILDDKGETLAFVTRSVSSFDRNADATAVFTSKDGLAHLNLITCEGIWNQVNGTYPERLVVFTDAIPGEGPIDISPKPMPTPIGISASSIPQSFPSLGQNLVQSTNNLFTTPPALIISSVILISILFITFKIFHH